MTEAAVTVLTAIIGVAILSVLVSKRADTANVMKAFGASFSQMLGTAVSPVTGGGGYSSPLGGSFSGFGY